ncbi:MAG: CCA tRNA nucleotidyltransferase [Lachnospiraceae bacterium]|nr:CCA tRNA nucleotidyltransferase [Lachnospiraceae bacterium]
MKIDLPQSVNAIISRLEQNGYEAWAVGGCVRDSLLGRKPKDWDITTSALPHEIKRIFTRTIDTGIEHGTVTVMYEGTGYETTTYRIDGKYSDSRHPDSVEFSRSLDEDLKRRDFTINAMAYSDNGGIVDLFGGINDLNDRIIRCVGNPIERFSEDALRILRAIRFSAELDFDIDPDTLEAAAQLKDRLKLISAERIHVELEKLIMSSHPEKIAFLHSTGVDEIILPELKKAIESESAGEHENSVRTENADNPANIYNPADSHGFQICRQDDPLTVKTLSALLSSAPHDKRIRWAILLHVTKSNTDLLQRLKFDNNTIHAVSELLCLENEKLVGLTDAEMRRLMHNAGSDNMPLLFEYRHAIDPEADLKCAIAQYEAVLHRGECTCLKELAVRGTDLIGCGVPAGKEIGRVLNLLLAKVIEVPELNTKEALLKEAAHLSTAK